MQLKDFKSGGLVQRRYLGKHFFYVESNDEVKILSERWFSDRGAKIEFKSLDDGNGGGCNQVIKQVSMDRENGIDAFGILDRDALAACAKWDAFFEASDDHFFKMHPFGEGIHVLRCWEIENYLLHPEAIEEFIADETGGAPRSLDQIMPELFEIACKLIPIVAVNLMLHFHGKRKLDVGFCVNQDFDPIIASLKSHIGKQLPSEALDAFDRYIESVSQFFEDESSRDLAAWLKIIRCLDGKRLLFWIKNHYQINSDMRWHLARRCKDRNLVSTMLDRPLLELFS